MIVISYYTKDTPYEQEVQVLRDSLIKLNLNYYIVGIPSQGSWQKNCQMKPKIIAEVLELLGEDVLYVDADAVFLREPDVFPIKCHFAAHVMDKAFWGQSTRKRTHSLMSGTLYFPFKHQSLEILARWREECEANPDLWDQRCLENIYKCYDFRELPVQYCCIDKTMHNVKNVVIRHRNVSRRWRKHIK